MPASKLHCVINSGRVASSCCFFMILQRSFCPLTFFWPALWTSLFPQRGTEGFWKSVAHYVPREPSEIRILNPYFIQEAAFHFIGLPFNNGLMGKGVRHTQGALPTAMERLLQSVGLESGKFWLIYKYAACHHNLRKFDRWLSPWVTPLALLIRGEKSKVEKFQMILRLLCLQSSRPVLAAFICRRSDKATLVPKKWPLNELSNPLLLNICFVACWYFPPYDLTWRCFYRNAIFFSVDASGMLNTCCKPGPVVILHHSTPIHCCKWTCGLCK